MSQTYLTTEELSKRIKYDARTIRERLKDSVLLEGIHYIRPFGGRKILYIWEKIEKDMIRAPSLNILMAGIQ
ncbi:Transcription-repair coupling factor (superfamily II helicase) [gamma proteobacterium IMCC2047]|nr:Transcription-repair coupling factor (superfamily II helicase) [gamma proteobacterium IMCC2047]